MNKYENTWMQIFIINEFAQQEKVKNWNVLHQSLHA